MKHLFVAATLLVVGCVPLAALAERQPSPASG